MPPELLTSGQVARLLRVSPQHVRQLADAGCLPCITTPLGRLFDAAAVARLASERRARARRDQRVRMPSRASA